MHERDVGAVAQVVGVTGFIRPSFEIAGVELQVDLATGVLCVLSLFALSVPFTRKVDGCVDENHSEQ